MNKRQKIYAFRDKSGKLIKPTATLAALKNKLSWLGKHKLIEGEIVEYDTTQGIPILGVTQDKTETTWGYKTYKVSYTEIKNTVEDIKNLIEQKPKEEELEDLSDI